MSCTKWQQMTSNQGWTSYTKTKKSLAFNAADCRPDANAKNCIGMTSTSNYTLKLNLTDNAKGKTFNKYQNYDNENESKKSFYRNQDYVGFLLEMTSGQAKGAKALINNYTLKDSEITGSGATVRVKKIEGSDNETYKYKYTIELNGNGENFPKNEDPAGYIFFKNVGNLCDTSKRNEYKTDSGGKVSGIKEGQNVVFCKTDDVKLATADSDYIFIKYVKSKTVNLATELISSNGKPPEKNDKFKIVKFDFMGWHNGRLAGLSKQGNTLSESYTWYPGFSGWKSTSSTFGELAKDYYIVESEINPGKFKKVVFESGQKCAEAVKNSCIKGGHHCPDGVNFKIDTLEGSGGSARQPVGTCMAVFGWKKPTGLYGQGKILMDHLASTWVTTRIDKKEVEALKREFNTCGRTCDVHDDCKVVSGGFQYAEKDNGEWDNVVEWFLRDGETIVKYKEKVSDSIKIMEATGDYKVADSISKYAWRSLSDCVTYLRTHRIIFKQKDKWNGVNFVMNYKLGLDPETKNPLGNCYAMKSRGKETFVRAPNSSSIDGKKRIFTYPSGSKASKYYHSCYWPQREDVSTGWIDNGKEPGEPLDLVECNSAWSEMTLHLNTKVLDVDLLVKIESIEDPGKLTFCFDKTSEDECKEEGTIKSGTDTLKFHIRNAFPYITEEGPNHRYENPKSGDVDCDNSKLASINTELKIEVRQKDLSLYSNFKFRGVEGDNRCPPKTMCLYLKKFGKKQDKNGLKLIKSPIALVMRPMLEMDVGCGDDCTWSEEVFLYPIAKEICTEPDGPFLKTAAKHPTCPAIKIKASICDPYYTPTCKVNGANLWLTQNMDCNEVHGFNATCDKDKTSTYSSQMKMARSKPDGTGSDGTCIRVEYVHRHRGWVFAEQRGFGRWVKPLQLVGFNAIGNGGSYAVDNANNNYEPRDIRWEYASNDEIKLYTKCTDICDKFKVKKSVAKYNISDDYVCDGTKEISGCDLNSGNDEYCKWQVQQESPQHGNCNNDRDFLVMWDLKKGATYWDSNDPRKKWLYLQYPTYKGVNKQGWRPIPYTRGQITPAGNYHYFKGDEVMEFRTGTACRIKDAFGVFCYSPQPNCEYIGPTQSGEEWTLTPVRVGSITKNSILILSDGDYKYVVGKTYHVIAENRGRGVDAMIKVTAVKKADGKVGKALNDEGKIEEYEVTNGGYGFLEDRGDKIYIIGKGGTTKFRVKDLDNDQVELEFDYPKGSIKIKSGAEANKYNRRDVENPLRIKMGKNMELTRYPNGITFPVKITSNKSTLGREYIWVKTDLGIPMTDSSLAKYGPNLHPNLSGIKGNFSCPAGQRYRTEQESRDDNAPTCVDCLKGFYSNAVDITCRACPVGTFLEVKKGAGVTSCKSCPKGSYNDVATGVSECKACPTGRSNSVENKTALTDCLSCATGRYQNQVGQSSCKICGKGLYSNTTNAVACINCLKGKYQDQVEQTAETGCKECPAGSITPTDGQSVCEKCEKGKYQNQTNKTVCIVCTEGSMAASKGLAACTACDAGLYQDQTAKSECKQCETGKRQNSTGQQSCILCSAGKFNQNVGLADAACYSCYKGLYQSKTGESKCETCEDGSFQNQDGQTSCTESNCRPSNKHTMTCAAGKPFCDCDGTDHDYLHQKSRNYGYGCHAQTGAAEDGAINDCADNTNKLTANCKCKDHSSTGTHQYKLCVADEVCFPGSSDSKEPKCIPVCSTARGDNIKIALRCACMTSDPNYEPCDPGKRCTGTACV
eukprot:g5175.t1